MDAFVETAGVQLFYSHELADVTGLNPVFGQYTINEALELLLEASQLSSGLTKSGVIVTSRTNSALAHDWEENKMTSGKVRKGLLASVSALIFGAGGQVSAQDNNDGVTVAQERDVIVVSANSYGEEDINDMTMSISVIGSEEIAGRSIVGLSDILNTLPSVSILDQVTRPL